MFKLHGVCPALVTPFDQGDQINEKALQDLVKMNMDQGVDGFYVGGSSAEAFLLTIEERKRILEIVMAEVQGKAKVLAHIGCISTSQAMELGEHAAEQGADAVSAIPPFYYQFSFEEIKEYYSDLVKASNLPMLIYNFPAQSGFTFSTDQFRELFSNPKIVGVKHTSMNFYDLERIKAIDDNIIVMNGPDQAFLGGISMGANGGIGTTYNFMAPKFITIRNSYKTDMDKARRVQREVNEIIAQMLEVGVIPAAKYILTTLGIDIGYCRKPFRKLNEDDKKKVSVVLNKYL